MQVLKRFRLRVNDIIKAYTNDLTPWELVYNIFIPRNWPKTSSFQLPYWRHSSSADCARELFKPSGDLAGLLVCIRKKVFAWGWQIFCEWLHKWRTFSHLGPLHLALGPNR